MSGPVTQVTPSHQTAGSSVEVIGVTKTFTRASGERIKPLDNISLSVAPREILVLLGPSGCGKTTLLRCIAGLEKPSEGEIRIHGESVYSASTGRDVPPERRSLGMIFQSYALWPHLTVAQNIEYPLVYQRKRISRGERRERVQNAMNLVGIPDVARQYPGQLSGGQQQRVALARALIAESDVILFDEPLSNVDAKVREELRRELLELQRRVGFTAIYVTHDQVEAMELSDNIVVLRSGRVEQSDSPQGTYLRPRTRYVAHFIGTANELDGEVTMVDGNRATILVDGSFELVGTVPEHLEVAVGERVHAIWRPEHTIVATSDGSSGRPGIAAHVVVTRFLGATSELICSTTFGTDVRCVTTGAMVATDGEEVVLSVPTHQLLIYPADSHDAHGLTGDLNAEENSK